MMMGAVSFSSGCASLPRIVILHDPLSPEEHFRLAVAYEQKKEYDFALKEYGEAAGEGKLAGASHTQMANIYQAEGKTDLAESHYLKAIGESPASGAAYNNLAWLYLAEGKNLDRAEELLRTAIIKDPARSPYYLDTLASVYEKKGAWERAIEALEEAEKTGFSGNKGAEIEFWDHMEKIYTRLGREKEAGEAGRRASLLKNAAGEGAGSNER